MSSSSNDEIDLQQLAINVIRYFGRYYRFISICLVLGIALGLTFYKLLPSVYESEMIVMSDILTESYSDRITESLDRLIKEKNDSILAQRLGLTRAEALSINSLEIKSAKKDAKQEGKDEVIFLITVEVGDKAILTKLQNGLIDLLRNNEFVKTRVRQREEMYRALIKKIGGEIRSLDSLKQRLFQGKPISSNKSDMMLVDPSNIYSTIIELSKDQLNYKNALELFNSIQLIEGFTPFQKPSSPKLSIALLSGFALGFIGAIGILTMKGLLKMARKKTEVENENQ